MSTLDVTGLTKDFATVRALDGVDLQVPHGSVTAVLGPSGCGKTTLLRLLAGFVRPDAGRITIDGEVVADAAGRAGRFVAPQHRNIGYVPQEGALFPHVDVAGNIGFGLPKAERTDERINALLSLVGLRPEHARRQPHELSGGQQQRVALARAMAPGPAVILLDEPFSSLDAGLRAATGQALVTAIRAAETTAVLVTHDQDEALSLADQVVVLREGRLIQAAEPQQLYRHPADVDLARFVGGAVTLPGVDTGGTVECLVGRLPVADPDATRGLVDVLVRPEQVRLDVPSEIKATVRHVSFYGHDSLVHLALDDGSLLQARLSGSATLPQLGDRVPLTVTGTVLTFPRHVGIV